jgi:tetratricopeptide (TPR) repeat protein
MRLLPLAMAAMIGSSQDAPKWLDTSHESRRNEIVKLLEQRKFRQARDAAQELNRRVPDDVAVYGLLAQAQIELGEFDQAEANVDWMFRLRPPSFESLTLGARIREHLGDIEGALDFCGQALRLTDPADTARRDRVYALTAGIEARAGRMELARRHLSLIQDPGLRRSASAELETTHPLRRNP